MFAYFYPHPVDWMYDLIEKGWGWGGEHLICVCFMCINIMHPNKYMPAIAYCSVGRLLSGLKFNKEFCGAVRHALHILNDMPCEQSHYTEQLGITVCTSHTHCCLRLYLCLAESAAIPTQAAAKYAIYVCMHSANVLCQNLREWANCERQQCASHSIPAANFSTSCQCSAMVCIPDERTTSRSGQEAGLQLQRNCFMCVHRALALHVSTLNRQACMPA